MRKLSEILHQKRGLNNKAKLDDKSIFYFFNKVIEKEFGNKGLENLKPVFWKNGKLFIESRSSVWGGELWINRAGIAKKINQEIGADEVCEIKVKN